jgi:hypothetical protein
VHIPDEVTVHLPTAPTAPSRRTASPCSCPVPCWPPAPTPEAGHAGEGPVFVDDGGRPQAADAPRRDAHRVLSHRLHRHHRVSRWPFRTSPRRSDSATSCRTWCPAPLPWSPRRRRLPRPRRPPSLKPTPIAAGRRRTHERRGAGQRRADRVRRPDRRADGHGHRGAHRHRAARHADAAHPDGPTGGNSGGETRGRRGQPAGTVETDRAQRTRFVHHRALASSPVV